MNWIAATLLGVVQGLTEFLPVSSSAHLVLARAFFGWNVDEGSFGLAFDVSLHVGTLIALVLFFRRDIVGILAALPEALRAERGPGKLLRLIVIGTIPVVIAGAVAAKWLEEHFRTPTVIAGTLIIGGIWLIVAEKFGSQDRDEDALSSAGAFITGVAEATAIVPGMSRSGSTISMAMLLGLTRESAARFSFLLGIPAILGAAVKEAPHIIKLGVTAQDGTLFLIGMTVSAIVGYLTIRYFLKYLAAHSLNVFAYYRIALAVVTIVWLVTRRA
jgi:undecaprenyl-diphosphatase